MPRKVEPGQEVTYSMLRALRQSTMKSEPTLPPVVSLCTSAGGFVSPAVCGLAGTAALAGRDSAATARLAAANPMTGPAATAPARNWRRFILGVLDTVPVPGLRLPLLAEIGRNYEVFNTRKSQLQDSAR